LCAENIKLLHVNRGGMHNNQCTSNGYAVVILFRVQEQGPYMDKFRVFKKVQNSTTVSCRLIL
jgi:hypothetical protein